MKLFQDIVLDSARMSLLNRFGRIKDYGFYLAGGTALALQYGHRVSEDFDFFKEGGFSTGDFLQVIHHHFPKAQVTHEVKDTIYIQVDGVKISFIGVEKLSLVSDLIPTPYFPMASAIDIGVMKLATIIKRAEFKDYVDLYHILDHHDLQTLINLVENKYGLHINEIALKKALLYTDDLIENVQFIGKKLDKETIKKFFLKKLQIV